MHVVKGSPMESCLAGNNSCCCCQPLQFVSERDTRYAITAHRRIANLGGKPPGGRDDV